MSPAAAPPDRRHADGRLLGRSLLVGGMAAAVLAGAAAAAPGDRWLADAAAAPRAAARAVAAPPAAPAPRTVRVDPERCTSSAPDPSVHVVCRVDQVAEVLIDRDAVVLSGREHRGALDLRRRSGVTVRGEAGAVLDADGARYALSLRDVRDVRVESLVLRGGTAQTVWVERSERVALRSVVVQGSLGSGVQVRDTSGFSLTSSRVQDATSAGVMELTGVTGSHYADLDVTGNGRDPSPFNGDGLQLAGTRVHVDDVRVTGNGSSALYEHGVYVSAHASSVLLERVRSWGNAGVAVKLGGSGTLQSSVLTDDRIALYCATTTGPGWTVRTTEQQPARTVAQEPGCRLRG